MPLELKFDWMVVVLALVVLSVLALFLRSERHWFLILRFTVYLILLILALQPTISHLPAFNPKPNLVLLLDVSKSMGIEDPVERIESAKKILRESVRELENHFKLSYYQFSQGSSKTTLKELLNAKPFGSGTNIATAIQQAAREKRDGSSAILLFSDGTRTSVEREQEVPSGIPVYSVGFGKMDGIRDIALKELRVSDFAFKGKPVECSLKVSHFGFSGKTIPVLLKEKRAKGMELVSSKNILLDGPETEINFRFVPSAIGSMEYQLEIPVQEGEIAKKNNLLSFRLEVGREKIRVLYLCGQPSPEYAFLRQVLKSDPSVELVSFVILRNPENVVPVPEDQLSLIPFPSHDIFVRTLSEFDLLIFENFTYTRFGILTSHLENIQRFVEERGGGFLMMGGENSFGRGGYAGTAIERILPVVLAPGSETVENQPVSVRLMEAQHPIFEIADSLAENQKLWKEMPALSGFHKLPVAKPDAQLLATFAENGLPAIVGWQRGKGRVLSMSTLSTWQWALGVLERGGSQSHYVQFWRQAIRWLLSSTEEKPLRLVFSKPTLTLGDKTSVKLLLQSEKLRRLRNPELQLFVQDPSKNSFTIPLVVSGKHEYRADWVSQAEGEHLFIAVVREGKLKIEEQRKIVVERVDLELENPYPDHTYLKELAAKSGGEYFSADEFSPQRLKEKIKIQEQVSAAPVQKALWTNPWLVLLPLSFLLLEWGWRRYKGGI